MKRIKINFVFRLQCSFENSDDSLRVRKMEIESSITKRLRMQHFFRQKNALWSHRDSWGGGSICVKTWCLVGSHAQHPDHYPSLSRRNLLSTVLSLWVSTLAEGASPTIPWGPEHSGGRVGKVLLGLRLFCKSTTKTLSTTARAQTRKDSIFSPTSPLQYERRQEKEVESGDVWLLLFG